MNLSIDLWNSNSMKVILSNFVKDHWFWTLWLRENTEIFLVLIFLYLDRIRRFTPQISVFSPNTGKYGPEKTPHMDTFHAVFEHWTMLIVFLFLVLINFIWLTIKRNNLRTFYSRNSRKHDGSSIFAVSGPMKLVLLTCPSVCSSVFDAFSSGFPQWNF